MLQMSSAIATESVYSVKQGLQTRLTRLLHWPKYESNIRKVNEINYMHRKLLLKYV